MIDVRCYSHTADNAGDHFTQPDIQKSLGHYHSMMYHFTKAKAIFEEVIGIKPKGYSCIRWWSLWEELEQLSTNFPSVLVFLNRCDSEDSCASLLIK